MKKFLSVMLTLFVVCMSMVVVSADAQGATVTATAAETVTANSEFTVSVVLADNPGMVSLRFKVNFDKDVLEFVSLTDAGLLHGKVAEAPAADVNNAGSVTLYWSDGLASENNTANGTIATITFKALTETDATAIALELLDSFTKDLEEVAVVVTGDEFAIGAEVTEGETTVDTADTTDVDTDTDTASDTDTATDTDTNTDSDTATDTASDTTDAEKPDVPATGDGILVVSLASVIALAAGCVVYSKKRHN